jgi:hypothetical protein
VLARKLMKNSLRNVLVAIMTLCAGLFAAGTSTAEVVSFEFDVCGAPNERVPGWVPNGDPNVNGKVKLTV